MMFMTRDFHTENYFGLGYLTPLAAIYTNGSYQLFCSDAWRADSIYYSEPIHHKSIG